MVNHVIQHQLRCNVEAFVDDMLVKSPRAKDHLTDLKETFDSLWWYNIRLNPVKRAFRLLSGKFLDYMITKNGIEVDPEKS